MIALGLLLLVAAAIVTLVGVLTNSGGAHALNSDFSLFGYHFHGSAGQLLLIGVIVGAVGMLGLNMLLAGIGRGVHPPSFHPPRAQALSTPGRCAARRARHPRAPALGDTGFEACIAFYLRLRFV